MQCTVIRVFWPLRRKVRWELIVTEIAMANGQLIAYIDAERAIGWEPCRFAHEAIELMGS
jgi:hypothetical protein